MSNLEITFTLEDGCYPQEAEGTVNGYPYYFWYQNPRWGFSLALDDSYDIYATYESEHSFYIVACWLSEERFLNSEGHIAMPREMPEQTVKKLVELCANEFIRQHAKT